MMRSRSVCSSLFLLITLMTFWGCESDKAKKELPDTPLRGVLRISCDESFRPVMEQQAYVYENLYPEAHIKITYKPEAECLKDILVDSIQMVIATRGFSAS